MMFSGVAAEALNRVLVVQWLFFHMQEWSTRKWVTPKLVTPRMGVSTSGGFPSSPRAREQMGSAEVLTSARPASDGEALRLDKSIALA